MAEIVFGTNIAFAAKRWPEPEQWVRVVKDLGLRHVEFSFDVLDPLLAHDLDLYKRTREVCEDNGIVISSATTGTSVFLLNMLADTRPGMHRRAQQWYEQAIKAASHLGAKGVGGYMGTLTLTQMRDRESRGQVVRQIRNSVFQLAGLAERTGLEYIAWEVQPTRREYPVNIDETQDLIEAAGVASLPIKLCLDVGHACLPSGSTEDRDPYAWLGRFGSHTRIVQLQQTDGAQDRHWPFTAEFNQKGIIDPARVLKVVREWDTDQVDLMLEIGFRPDVPEDKVIDDLRASVDFWRTHLEAGVAR
ncbi:sugar phosphate isomerase/epimerase family protein [Streptomyces sp. OE57]|uniref:sugar phosphate isomerase/epimerase family protein n=1 Tax=Streptomyces lacaronensis TaxID=3379885 RepID=UPI0039B75EAE